MHRCMDARITVRAADVIAVYGLSEEPSDDPSQRVFAINGQHLTLDNGLTGPTFTDASYARYVPSLMAISDATDIREEVERGVLFEGAHAYVDLRGGMLSAAEGTVVTAVFTGARSRAPQCVAMSVSYNQGDRRFRHFRRCRRQPSARSSGRKDPRDQRPPAGVHDAALPHVLHDPERRDPHCVAARHRTVMRRR